MILYQHPLNNDLVSTSRANSLKSLGIDRLRLPGATAKLKCPHCNIMIRRRMSDLSRHVREVHYKIKPHKCGFCDQPFSRASDLKKHVKRKHGKGTWYYLFVGHFFYVYSYLWFFVIWINEMTVLITLIEFLRRACNWFFTNYLIDRFLLINQCVTNEVELESHKQTVPCKTILHLSLLTSPRSNRFSEPSLSGGAHCKECPHCLKLFNGNGQLNRHINAVHLKLKPFKCYFCDNSFAANHLRVKHIKRAHNRNFDEKSAVFFWAIF